MSAGKFLAGFIVGGMVGSLIGLLLAPQSGEETREKIYETSRDIMDKAGDTVKDIQNKADNVIGDIQKKGDEIIEKFSDLMYFRSDDDLSVINMVKKGMGVTVLPSLVLKGNCDGVQTLRLLPPLKRKLGVAFKKRKTFELKLFLEYVKETNKNVLRQ